MRISYVVLILSLPFMQLFSLSFEQAAEEIVEAGIFLNRFGLCPATSSNLSIRIEENSILVTTSGTHKGDLSTDDVLLVDLDGKAQTGTKQPSAETGLHTAIYAVFKDVGAVIHTHSSNGIVLTRVKPFEKMVVTEGYEIHKVFPSFKTHDSVLHIPIFENSQDIDAMAIEVTGYLKAHPHVYGFLIRGHGFYTWGRDMKEAKIRIEAFEHLFETELKILAITKNS